MKNALLSIALVFLSIISYGQHTETFIKFHKDYFEHFKNADTKWIESKFADTNDLLYLYDILDENEYTFQLPWCAKRNLKQGYYEAKESYFEGIKQLCKEKMAIKYNRLVPFFKSKNLPEIVVYHIYFNTPFDSLKIIPSCITFVNKKGEVKIFGKAFHIDPVKKKELPKRRSIESIRAEKAKYAIEPPPPRHLESKVYMMVEQMPKFGRGDDDLVNYLKDNLRYPSLAKQNKIEGDVYVSFIVNLDGSLEQIKIKRDIGGGCGAEAVRLVKSMPKWNPGKQNGEVKRVEFTIPVQFSLKK